MDRKIHGLMSRAMSRAWCSLIWHCIICIVRIVQFMNEWVRCLAMTALAPPLSAFPLVSGLLGARGFSLPSSCPFMLSSILAALKSPHPAEETQQRPPRYANEDTSPTSQREILGWYAYGVAAEVFAVCGVGM